MTYMCVNETECLFIVKDCHVLHMIINSVDYIDDSEVVYDMNLLKCINIRKITCF